MWKERRRRRKRMRKRRPRSSEMRWMRPRRRLHQRCNDPATSRTAPRRDSLQQTLPCAYPTACKYRAVAQRKAIHLTRSCHRVIDLRHIPPRQVGRIIADRDSDKSTSCNYTTRNTNYKTKNFTQRSLRAHTPHALHGNRTHAYIAAWRRRACGWRFAWLAPYPERVRAPK